MEFDGYAQILLDNTSRQVFLYGIPIELSQQIRLGTRVEVPFRNRMVKGLVKELLPKTQLSRVRGISRILSNDSQMPSDLYDLAKWMSRYYCAPLGKVLKSLTPSAVRHEKGHKEQLCVRRKISRKEMVDLCCSLREQHPAQAAVLDVMLQVKKEILLTELLGKAGVSRSPVQTLVKNKVLDVNSVAIHRSPLDDQEYFRSSPKRLNAEQQEALEAISNNLVKGEFRTFLLYGVTGSGKTEVYLQAIQQALDLGKQVLILVPEISLTPQTIQRFRSRFDVPTAILHSRLSAGERYDEWHRIRQGKANIVIGARSAIFSPLPQLGLIIVDEEHEDSYKQAEEMPCYHARDVAIVRAHFIQATVILGSATPSLESFENTRKGKYELLTLSQRADHASLPEVTVVDMREERNRVNGSLFSEPLIDGIKKRWEQGEQTILFLNKRGYHSAQVCRQCGEATKCQHCDVALTYHKGEQQLLCHLCGFQQSPPPQHCTSCGSGDTMKFRGVGTELVEKALGAILKGIRIIRMDADTTRHKGSHERLLRDFRTGKADVLIGTQMVAKGLHFPQVTLVGVVQADAGLQIPDFRASEKAFQILTQVAGRSGRGTLKGEVIFQTRMPENNILQHVIQQDYLAFFEEEIQVRKAFDFPPSSHLIRISLTGKEERAVQKAAEELRKVVIQSLPKEVTIQPILPAGYARIKGNFRFHFLVFGKNPFPITRILHEILEKKSWGKGIYAHVNVDPTNTYF